MFLAEHNAVACEGRSPDPQRFVNKTREDLGADLKFTRPSYQPLYVILSVAKDLGTNPLSSLYVPVS